MIRVCILTSRHDPYDDRIFYKEARSLRKAGYAVTIISPKACRDEEKEGVFVKRLKPGGRLSRVLHLGWVYGVVGFVRLGWQVRARIYHCHEWEPLIAAYLIRWLRKRPPNRRPVVITEIRDSFPGTWPSEEKHPVVRSIQTFIASFLDKAINCQADFLIAVEEPKAERYMSFGMERSRVLTVENYAPLDLFPFRPKPLDPKNLVLAYAGGLSFTRGLNTLAQAAVELARQSGVCPKLLLIGPFVHPEERREFLAYCRQNTQLLRLEMTGWIPHPDVAQRLSDADICFVLFYNSKRYDWVLSGKAGPLKLYEYMACGKPIIAVDLPALRETIRGSDCGLIVPQERGADAVVEAVEYYLTNPRELVRHGSNGRAAVERYYNWSRGEKKLLSVYEALLNP